MTAHPVKILASEVKLWPLADLIPYARNAKRHPPEQIAQLAASMRRFGWTMPVLVAGDGTIIAGHGRVLAAQELGLDEVPVIIADGWTEEQCRAYTLADNKLAENGEWDLDMLRLELVDLHDDGVDLGALGFSEKELEAAFKALEVTDGIQAGPEAKLTGTTKLRVGPYTVTVTNQQFHDWLAEVRAEVGDTKAAIEAEILSRLGFT